MDEQPLSLLLKNALSSRDFLTELRPHLEKKAAELREETYRIESMIALTGGPQPQAPPRPCSMRYVNVQLLKAIQMCIRDLGGPCSREEIHDALVSGGANINREPFASRLTHAINRGINQEKQLVQEPDGRISLAK